VPAQASPQAPVELQAIRLSGQEHLAVRASRKLRSDELLLPSFGATRLRMELDRIPLWRNDHVAIRQLTEDFARYPYLPRLKNSSVLVGAIRDGLGLLTWEKETFAYADSFDEGAQRYRGLRGGQLVSLLDSATTGLLVKPDVARKQMQADDTARGVPIPLTQPVDEGEARTVVQPISPPALPKRFHGSVGLDPTRVGRDAGKIAEEVIAHLMGLMGAQVTVTLDVDAQMPSGAPDQVVRTVTENSKTLRFTSQGFEKE
jgi:hypothetical protein